LLELVAEGLERHTRSKLTAVRLVALPLPVFGVDLPKVLFEQR
jgi:hypothetical protein